MIGCQVLPKFNSYRECENETSGVVEHKAFMGHGTYHVNLSQILITETLSTRKIENQSKQ